MTTLRDKTIRLAHTDPELRPLLLPLLKTAASGEVTVTIPMELTVVVQMDVTATVDDGTGKVTSFTIPKTSDIAAHIKKYPRDVMGLTNPTIKAVQSAYDLSTKAFGGDKTAAESTRGVTAAKSTVVKQQMESLFGSGKVNNVLQQVQASAVKKSLEWAYDTGFEDGSKGTSKTAEELGVMAGRPWGGKGYKPKAKDYDDASPGPGSPPCTPDGEGGCYDHTPMYKGYGSANSGENGSAARREYNKKYKKTLEK